MDEANKFWSMLESRLERLFLWLFIGPLAVVTNGIILLLCFAQNLFWTVVNLLQLNSQISCLSERYVVITGCDHGFGYFAALQLYRLGFNVFAGCLTDSGLEQLEVKAENPGGKWKNRLIPFSLNVVSEESVAQAKKFVTSKLPAGKGEQITTLGTHFTAVVQTIFCRHLGFDQQCWNFGSKCAGRLDVHQ